jgi:tetratricopeptide (TPR) repeat protein
MRAAIIALFCLAPAQARPLSQGYDHFYNLEYDQAIADFTAETEQHPGEPAGWNHLAHAILYRAMYRSGALESELVTGSNPFLRREKVQTTPAEDQQFNSAIDKSIGLCRAAQGRLAALGVAYSLRANYDLLVRKAWLDALHNVSRANDTFRQLLQLEPDNVDARLIPGVYDYVVGSLSWGYRFLGFLAGFHGNRSRGIHTIQTVAQQGATNPVDAKILLVAIYRREQRPAEALVLLDGLIRQFPRNHLFRFEVVQMYRDMGDRDKARAEIDRIRELRRNGAAGFRDLAPEKIDSAEARQ